ncbi:MAG: hypothetical protein R3D57_13780 [Hyphomicrobiaceae bacterium]
MSVTLRQAVPADRDAFASLLGRATRLESHWPAALNRLASYVFGPEAFVTVVLAEDGGDLIGAMAYYPGFNDAGLTINVVFLHVIEERRLGAAFPKLIAHARRLAGEKGAVSLNLAGAIFDNRTCGLLQSVRREAGADLGEAP